MEIDIQQIVKRGEFSYNGSRLFVYFDGDGINFEMESEGDLVIFGNRADADKLIAMLTAMRDQLD